MEDKKIARHAIRESAKGCTGGCITHFLIAIAAAILLGSLVVLIAIFLASALIPWEKEKRP